MVTILFFTLFTKRGGTSQEIWETDRETVLLKREFERCRKVAWPDIDLRKYWKFCVACIGIERTRICLLVCGHSSFPIFSFLDTFTVLLSFRNSQSTPLCLPYFVSRILFPIFCFLYFVPVFFEILNSL